MKSKSVLYLITGIAIGALGNLLLTPHKGLKSRRDVMKKSKKYKKAFKETADKYKEKLSNIKDTP